MTSLNKPVRRVTRSRLDSFYGADKDRRIVVTLIPGNGSNIEDTIELRPEGTRRPEFIKVSTVYRAALMSRVNGERLEKARAKKKKLAEDRQDKKWRSEVLKARRESQAEG